MFVPSTSACRGTYIWSFLQLLNQPPCDHHHHSADVAPSPAEAAASLPPTHSPAGIYHMRPHWLIGPFLGPRAAAGVQEEVGGGEGGCLPRHRGPLGRLKSACVMVDTITMQDISVLEPHSAAVTGHLLIKAARRCVI